VHQAQDTFVAELDSGPVLVQKGSVWSSGHPVVKLDAGRDLLFKRLETDEEEPAPKRGPGRPRKNAAAGGDDA